MLLDFGRSDYTPSSCSLEHYSDCTIKKKLKEKNRKINEGKNKKLKEKNRKIKGCRKEPIKRSNKYKELSDLIIKINIIGKLYQNH